jgi:hypothetical protein
VHSLFLAYLDPTTGSIGYQVMISGLLAIAASCRIYWAQLKRLFSRRDGK